MTENVDKQVGYLVGKVEGLDSYVRGHMDSEEKKFASINRNLWVINVAVILMAFDVPLQDFAIKIFGTIAKAAGL